MEMTANHRVSAEGIEHSVEITPTASRLYEEHFGWKGGVRWLDGKKVGDVRKDIAALEQMVTGDIEGEDPDQVRQAGQFATQILGIVGTDDDAVLRVGEA